MTGAKKCANYSICRQHYVEGCGRPSEERKNNDYLSSVNRKRSYPQLLACSKMCQDFTPIFENQHMGSVTDRATEVVRSPNWHQVGCNTGNAKFFDGERVSREAGSKDALITDVDKVLEVCYGNDSCSLSKSNLKLSSASFKVEKDDSGGCSSSGGSVAGKVPGEMLERGGVCISILESGGVLDRGGATQDRGETEGIISTNYSSKPCRVCQHLESTLNLLICDNCEDAFHMSCCDPPVTRVPLGDWFCNSCLKKQHKILKEESTSSETGSDGYVASDELGTIELMLRDPEPYITNARIGDEYQATVPKWSGPENRDSDFICYPSEVDISNDLNMQNATEPLKLSSIGNWLQCREVIAGLGQGDDEIVCGKWRRAPLLEVQTDEFECFSCIRWDPAHADCAVPQELDTKEVMKQLKYRERLRPRVSTKRRKLGNSKSTGSQGL